MNIHVQNSVDHALLSNVTNSVVRVRAEEHEEPFHFYAISRLRLASLIIHNIESDPVTVCRRDEDISEDRVFDILLHVQLEGTAEITQSGKTFTLGAGAIAMVPGGIPYSVNYPEKGQKIILRIPYNIFHERVLGREPRDFSAVIFRGGLVLVVIDLLKSLTLEKNDDLTSVEQFVLADSFLALVGAVVRSQSATKTKGSEKSVSSRLYRILCYLEEHFSDHELTPTRIAEANFISVRHLHGLFQQYGTTVSKWIWDRRLRACREDLLDPAMSNLTVCEIAYRRGFNDSAHFSRTFKEHFGVSPGHLRTQARGDCVAHRVAMRMDALVN